MTPHHPPGAPDPATVPSAPGGAGRPTGRGPVSRPEQPVRPARREDVAEILAMVRDLAAYERAADEVRASEDQLAGLLFGEGTTRTPATFCHVAPAGDADRDHRLAGFALWFVSTSTWTGRHGIYLEDLYVRPQYRGAGIGLGLMSQLARVCLDRGYSRLEWSVLDWNTPALEFYRSLGATAMDEWTVHRLSADSLTALAERVSTR